MTDKFDRMPKEVVMAYTSCYAGILMEKLGKASTARISVDLPDIPTKQLPNSILEHCL
jgi:hypothetical protein